MDCLFSAVSIPLYARGVVACNTPTSSGAGERQRSGRRAGNITREKPRGDDLERARRYARIASDVRWRSKGFDNQGGVEAQKRREAASRSRSPGLQQFSRGGPTGRTALENVSGGPKARQNVWSPSEVQGPLAVARNESPRPVHPLMEVRCSPESCMRMDCEDVRVSPLPQYEASYVSDGPRGISPSAVHRQRERAVSSSLELVASFRVLRPATCLPARPPYGGQIEKRLPWGSVPSSRHQPMASTHCARHPTLRYVPSSAFRAPSTVCSATCLAGLFRPAATSRVRPPGDCPSRGAVPGFPGPFMPSCRWAPEPAV